MGLLSAANMEFVLERIRFHEKENALKNVGIDHHKQAINNCTIDPRRRIVDRRRFLCS